MKKTLGELIDELITLNIKIYMAIDQETVAHQEGDMALAGQIGQKVLALNARRGKYINAINELGGEEAAISEKSYG